MIPVAIPRIGDKERANLNACIDTTWVSSNGPFNAQFRQGLASYLGARHVVDTSNGTSALHLALIALGVGPGDEVIIPALSFIATLNAVFYVGATPVFVDVEKQTWGIDSSLIEERITKKTKAIIAVHLYGFACDIGKVMDIARAHNLFVIEDNAESLGATFQGKKLGTIGDIGTYSFFGNKIITTGEGGAVSTDNDAWAETMTIVANHGRKGTKTYNHTHLGQNYRMTNMQAGIGCAQLEQIEEFLGERQRIDERYVAALGSVLTCQKELPDTTHVMWMFSALVPESCSVEGLEAHLKEKEIDSRRVFAPMNQMPYLPERLRSLSFPNAQYIADHGITLPTYVDLSDADVDMIASAVKEFVA